MTAYIARRAIHAVIVIVIVSIVVFLLMRIIPGDPIDIMVAREVSKVYTPEMIEELREQYGFNDPLIVQYFRWAGNMLHGDFGRSLMFNSEIGPQLKGCLVVTLTIGLPAWVIGWIIGPVLGVISAVRRGKWIDDVVTTFANIGITAPSFWVAILLIFLFGVKLQILPIYGYEYPWVDFGSAIKHNLLPILVTALLPIASSCRQMRSSTLEVLGEDYIRTAWAKGLNERKTLLRHVLKNAMMPVVSLQGSMCGSIIGGSVIVESIFVIPGMGLFMVNALRNHDYPVIQAVALVMTIVIVIVNLCVDLLYGWLDPRIQYE
jgi:peptide/nickel transport system permease protein